MSKVKITASGPVNGEKVTLQCISDEGGSAKLFKDGKKAPAELQLLFEHHILNQCSANEKIPCVWVPELDSPESYWAAFHEIYFDELPKIEVDGELDTFGSPYSNEDTSGVVF